MIAGAVFQLYAFFMLAVVLRGGATPGRRQAALDAITVSTLVLVADPHLSSAGRIPVLLLLGAWALTVDPRSVLLRGTAVSAIVLVGEGLLVGAHEMGLVAVYMASLVAVMTAFAGVVQRARGDTEALHRRLDEASVEAADLARRERERLAQLLHDDALQRLLAARQDLELLQQADDDPSLRAVSASLAATTRSLRSLTVVHNNAVLEAAGADAAVRRIVADAADRAGLETEVQIRGTLAAQDAEVVYRSSASS